MYQVKEVNFATGESVEREFTEDELAQRELDWQNYQSALRTKAEAEEQAQAKRSAALAKLAAIGLDEDDLKALGL